MQGIKASLNKLFRRPPPKPQKNDSGASAKPTEGVREDRPEPGKTLNQFQIEGAGLVRKPATFPALPNGYYQLRTSAIAPEMAESIARETASQIPVVRFFFRYTLGTGDQNTMLEALARIFHKHAPDLACPLAL